MSECVCGKWALVVVPKQCVTRKHTIMMSKLLHLSLTWGVLSRQYFPHRNICSKLETLPKQWSLLSWKWMCKLEMTKCEGQ